MRVFISWSGEASHEVATNLKLWIKAMIQNSDPWLSSQDIILGTAWADQIEQALDEANVGIICLTPENIRSPWVYFEAGAIRKGLTSQRVITLLCGLEHNDLNPPLNIFHNAKLSLEGIKQILKTVNRALDNPLEDSVLNTVFTKFEAEIKEFCVEFAQREWQSPTNPAYHGEGDSLPIEFDSKLDRVIDGLAGLTYRLNDLESLTRKSMKHTLTVRDVFAQDPMSEVERANLEHRTARAAEILGKSPSRPYSLSVGLLGGDFGKDEE